MKEYTLEIADNRNENAEMIERNFNIETKKEESVSKDSIDLNNSNASSEVYNSNNSNSTNNSNNPNDSDNPSYERLVELKKKIHNLEKKILEKKKTQVQIKSKEWGKPLYRSFDEFYEYKKNYEEKENKIKNEAWKSLNKAKDIIENEKVEKTKDNEKYSYTKLKSERKGTVKQLKEFFQKIEEEKREKRKHALFVKHGSKPTNCFKRLDREWSKTREVCIKENLENKNSDTHLKTFPVKYAAIGEIKDENRKGSNGSFYNNKIVKIDGITITNKEMGEESEKEKDENENEKEKEIHYDMENRKNNDNISAKEIDILLGLIKEMKSNYETNKSHFSNLIRELENSNKYHIIEKLLDLLKLFEKAQKETSQKESSENETSQKEFSENETSQKESSENDVHENNNVFENNEMLMHLTHYENKLKEIEMRIKNIESKKEAEAEAKEMEKEKEKGEMEIEIEKKGDGTEIEENRDGIEIKAAAMKRKINYRVSMNESDKNITFQNQGNINDIDNASYANSCENNGSNKLKNKNKKKNNNKKKVKHFDWFYKSVNFAEEDLKTHNKKNVSNMEDSVENEGDDDNDNNDDDVTPFNINTNIKYYASDESEQLDGNNELFSWLKEKDVESVISQRTERNI